MADRFLCQKQLAKRWGISHRTLENWRYRGHGLPFLKLGSKVFYRIEDVEAYEVLQAQAGDLMLSAYREARYALFKDVAPGVGGPSQC